MPGGHKKIDEYNKSISAEKRKENARKAGSAPKKTKAKTIKQIAKIICENPAPELAKTALADFGVADEDMTTAALIALAVIRAAIDGDLKAVEKVERYIGQADTKRERLENKLLENKVKAVEGGALTDPIQILIAPREPKDDGGDDTNKPA